MADTLVADLQTLKERWPTEQPLEAVLALARSSQRWDVAMVVFEGHLDVWQAIKRDEILFRAKDALGDYLTTVEECGKDRAVFILRSIKRLASLYSDHMPIWREVFEGHLTQEEMDKTFPLIFEETTLQAL